MELTINFEKKYVYGISLILIVLIGIVSVIAYTYTTPIPNPGHGGDKTWIDVQKITGITPDEKDLQTAIDNGNFLGREGVPVRDFLTPVRDCIPDSPDPTICSGETYPISLNLGIKDICALRSIGEWNEGFSDTRNSECKIEKNGINEWILSTDNGDCINYCLNWG